VFFSLLLLFINFTLAETLDLGPHLRVDKKTFRDLKIPRNKILLLVSPQCSFCKIQLKKLDCLNKKDLIVLVDKSDGQDLHRLQIPEGFPVFLTTEKSLEYFKENLVYPMGLIPTNSGLKIFRGLKECRSLTRTYLM